MDQQDKASNDVQEEQNSVQQQQPLPPRKCPRCNSDNTKFCYYNNYCMSQPRYFCKACRRYWTHGGILRNIPVGSSSRKSKRSKKGSSSSSSSPSLSKSSSSPSLNSQSPSIQTKQVQSVTVPVLQIQETGLLGGTPLSSLTLNRYQPPSYTNDLVTALPSFQGFNQMGAYDPSDMCLFRDNICVGFNPSLHAHDARQFYHKGPADNLTYLSRGTVVSDAAFIGQDQTRWNRNLVNNMNTCPGTSSGCPNTNMNNCPVRTPYVNQDQWFGHQNYGPPP